MGLKRLNIALLISELEDPFGEEICKGASYAAEEMDANLFIFPGKYLYWDFEDIYRTRYDYQRTSLFDYSKLNDMDVYIICMGTIGTNISLEDRIEFLRGFNKPVVVLAEKADDYPTVNFDNKTGFKAGIRHLIEEHGRKHIGYVGGPASNEDAKERLAAYCEVIKECGLSYDENYIVYGDFTSYCDGVVRSLLKKNPNLDAIVFANDQMVIAGYKVFKEMGLDVGEDISVLGFDDAACAMTLEPNLSTIKADPLELGYQAIINIDKLLSGEIHDVVVPVVPVIRASCGCRKRHVTDFDVDVSELADADKREKILEETFSCLFGKNMNQGSVYALRESIAEYFCFVQERILAPDVKEHEFTRMFHMMKKIMHMQMEPYTNLSKISGMFESIYTVLKEKISDMEDNRRLSETYYSLYADVIFTRNRQTISKERNEDNVYYITTTFMRDVMNFTIGDERAYYSIIEKLGLLHHRSAYLCLFSEKVIRKKNEDYELPDEILLKAYLDRGEMDWLDPEDQKRTMKNAITDLYAERKDRVTVIVTLLFSATEQYGMCISEIEDGYLFNTVPIGYQMSATVKMIDLLKENEIMMQQLKRNIEEIKEKNQILDEISKSDELTQIYNRRGFLTMAQRSISRPSNKGRKALVIYGDMNNLKIINDRFGHEEGDYSLKLIAQILKEAFGKDSIVGRFGGDEFAVFTYASEDNTVRKIRKRVSEITKRKNEGNGKVYYVSLSLGICEFECGKEVVLKDLMDKADVDLYIEKRHKRNNILKNDDEAI